VIILSYKFVFISISYSTVIFHVTLKFISVRRVITHIFPQLCILNLHLLIVMEMEIKFVFDIQLKARGKTVKLSAI